MKVLFYVEKHGVYAHGIFGIYDFLQTAKSAADVLAAREPDDYHRFVVYQCPLGHVFDPEELEQIYVVSQSTAARAKSIG